MNFRKKLIPMILCLALILVLLPAPANAATVASGSCGENLTWTLDDAGTLTVSGTGPMTEYATSPDVPWDSYGEQIKQVIISAGVTRIDDTGRFAWLSAPVRVDAANKYYNSDSNGVLFNKDKTVLIASPGDLSGHYTVPNTVETIEKGAFNGCYITTITLPDSLEIIGDHAFMNCQDLETITIPRRVYSIGVRAFSPSYCLSGIYVAEDNLNFSHDSNGVLFNKDKTILIAVPGAISGHYAIPDTVRVIDNAAFNACNRLTDITIPESVTRFEDYAFTGCEGLRTITGGKGLKSIGAAAFFACDALTDIYYDGTMSQATRIQIGTGNESLQNAMFHFKPSVPGDMDGDGDKDTDDAVYLLLNVMFGDEDYPLAL